MVSSVRSLCPLVSGCIRVVLSIHVFLSQRYSANAEQKSWLFWGSVLYSRAGQECQFDSPLRGNFFGSSGSGPLFWWLARMLVRFSPVWEFFESQTHPTGSLSPGYTWLINFAIISGRWIPMSARM